MTSLDHEPHTQHGCNNNQRKKSTLDYVQRAALQLYQQDHIPWKCYTKHLKHKQKKKGSPPPMDKPTDWVTDLSDVTTYLYIHDTCNIVSIIIPNMKPNYKTTLLHNRHVIGYHTNKCCSISSFATNHYVYTDDELKEVHWITDQYLMHMFHISADSKCAFKGHFIGLEGDEIVLYMKVQSTDKLSVTRDKGTIK